MKTILKAPLTALMLAVMVIAAALILALPKDDFSDMENRVLATVDWRADDIDQQLERWLADHFPLHDDLVRVQASLSAALGVRQQKNVLIGSGGWLLEEPQGDVTAAAAANARALGELQKNAGVPFTLMLIPSSAQYVNRLPALYQNADQTAVIRRIGEISGLEALEAAVGGEEDYYRTDHHLTARGTRACYERLCAAWGLTPWEAEPYTAEGFLGSYWSKAPLFQVAAEAFTADLPAGVGLSVDGETRDSLLQAERLAGRNKYAALIDGTYGHAVLTNPRGEGALVILCDSYANALAPMLARHYARIDLVDPRYFSGSLSDLIAESGAERALVYFGLNTFSTSRALVLLEE